MRKVELVLILSLILAFIGREYQIGIVPYLFIGSFFPLLLMYFSMSFALFNGVRFRDFFRKNSYINIKAKYLLSAIFLGMTISLFFISLAFKIQHWPWGTAGLRITTLILATVTIAGIIKVRNGNTNVFFKESLPRASFYMSLGAYMLF